MNPRIGDVYRYTHTLHTYDRIYFVTLNVEESPGRIKGVKFYERQTSVILEANNQLGYTSRSDVPCYEFVGNLNRLKVNDIMVINND